MGKIIAVASGKGGTGKTTLTANLGAALAQKGKLVLLADMDMGLRNLDVTLGLENNIVYDISDVIGGMCDADDALLKCPGAENLYFLPAPQTKNASGITEEAAKKFWETVRTRFDYCILDCPAGLDGGFKLSAAAADEAVIVTTPDLASLRDADRAIETFSDGTSMHLVINRVRVDLIEKGIMVTADYCLDMLGIPLLAVICEDEELFADSLKGTLAVFNPDSLAGGAIRNAALRLEGESVPITDFSKKHGFKVFLRRIFGH